jgi:hypothetical protein
MLEFGFGKICITPKIGIRLFGQIEQITSTGKYTNLFARSLYLCSGGNNILIISCDLLVLPKEISDHIREKISKKTSVSFKNIIIHTTHTHAGPVVASIFGEENMDKEENEKIINGIINSAVSAFKSRKKGKIGIGRQNIENISFNRRYIMKDKTVEMHPHKDDPNILEAEGPVDPELNAVLILDEDNKIMGTVASFSCHLTTLERDNSKFSADFPAYAEKYLMKNLGNNNFIVLYLNGPCGNICPINVKSKNTIEVGNQHSEKMGEEFAKALLKIINNYKVLKEDIEVKVNYKEIKIPIREITEEMIAQAKSTVKEFKSRKLKVPRLSNYGVESYKDKSVISACKLIQTDFWKNVSANEILSLHKKYKDNNLEIVPLTVAKIGDILFIGAPAELFVEFSLSLKDKFKKKYGNVIIVELANGWVGYVPTKKAFSPKVGGYEVQFLNSSKLCEDAGDIMVKEITKMEEELK